MAFTLSGLRLLPLLSILLDGASSLPSKRAPIPDVSSTSLGCFTDNEGGKRALTGNNFAADDMTVEKCASFCSKFQVFGLEYGIECYCGNSRDENSREVSATDCSFPCPGDAGQTCGAGNRLNLYSIANPTVQGPASLPGATSLGCFVDNADRLFPNNIISTDDMTAAKCAVNCADFKYFGTQWGRECYCGSTAPTVSAPSAECSMPCAGDDKELCGAGMRLNVYKFDTPASTTTQASTTPTATPPPPVDGYEYQGCHTDDVQERALSGQTFSDPAMTLAKCATFCKDNGYGFFGVEYGFQCFCSTDLDASSRKVSDSECGMACGGDDFQKCGGPSRLNVYADPALTGPAGGNLASIGEFTYSSCRTDDTADRSLKAVDYRTDDMTVEKCAERCKDYAYFGLQFARECYCGNELGGQAAPEKDCSLLCVGSDKQWCGGPLRLNVYAKGAASSSTTTPVAESTTSEASTTSTEEVATTASDAVTSTTSEIPTASSFPTPTTVTSPTTTEGPSLTTITDCPPAPTWVGTPEMCFYPELPPDCESLTSSLHAVHSASMSMYLEFCWWGVTWPGMTAPHSAMAATCFPTSTAEYPPDVAAATSTMHSAYSCLKSALACTFDSACVTKTYLVGQVPVPTPSTGVDLIQDGGFESGTFGNWTILEPSAHYTLDISNGRPKTGGFALRGQYHNTASADIYLQRTLPVEPGKQYQVKASYLHESNMGGAFYLYANDFMTEYWTAVFEGKPVNVWEDRVLTFTASTSWVTVKLNIGQNMSGGRGSPGGMNTVWIDDVTLIRLD